MINSSGGPSKFFRAKDLRPTGEFKVQEFHFFPHGMGANLAETKEKRVRVFEVDIP